MTEPVLHHYPVSPFAEKARLMLGFKRLAWNTVPVGFQPGTGMMKIFFKDATPEYLAAFGKDRSAWRGLLRRFLALPRALAALAAGRPAADALALFAHARVHGAHDRVRPRQADRIVIRRSDPRAGTVQVHFPRFGFQLNKPA